MLLTTQDFFKDLDSNTTIIGASADLGELFAKIRMGVDDASRLDTNNIDTFNLSDKSSSENDIGPCEEVNVRRAGQKLISEKLDIHNDIDVVLVGIELKEWEDSSMGCKVDSSEEIVDMQIKGFSALFEYEGATFEIHTNSDVSMVVECTK